MCGYCDVLIFAPVEYDTVFSFSLWSGARERRGEEKKRGGERGEESWLGRCLQMTRLGRENGIECGRKSRRKSGGEKVE